MSFSDTAKVLSYFITEHLGICESGVVMNEDAGRPFLLLISTGGQQDENNIFRTDYYSCQLHADSDWEVTGRSAREIAVDYVRRIQDAILEDVIWTPFGMIDSVDINTSDSDGELEIERDKWMIEFSIMVDSRAD